MKNRIFRTGIVWIVLLGIVTFQSCEKEKIFPVPINTTEELSTIMNDYYFWIDSIPYFDYENYLSPQDLLEVMRYRYSQNGDPRDRWSYITTKQENDQYYVEGKFIGYGFGYAPDDEDKLRVTYLYEDCDFNADGIKRGWIINKINETTVGESSSISSLLGSDNVGISNTFEFESPTGTIVTKSYPKKEVDINTVLYTDVITDGAKKIGYLVFESFIGPSEDELTEAFLNFKAANITDLVIDLRYNGGGLISIVEYLASLIIPDNLNNKKFLSYVHNKYVSDLNKSINLHHDPNSLNLSKVYFIAGQGSASASKAIINGLDPYMDVYIVGDDTYGKPVGMYSFPSRISDLIYVPISFSLVNADGFGNYYNGLKADSYVNDDVYHNFGTDEAIFSEVMNHITTGPFSSNKSSFELRKAPKKEIRSIKDERGSL